MPRLQPYLLTALSVLATTATATATTIATASTSTTDKFPLPFDTSMLDKNFTNTACPNFIKANLASPPPEAALSTCHPLSVLLRDSSAFFTALHSESSTTQILNTACSAPVESCAKTLSDVANKLIAKDTCRKDYELGNPLVVNAYTDLLAYEPIYRASCLKSNASGKFCFLDALFGSSNSSSNSSSSSSTPPPGDYDIFSIPLGHALAHNMESSTSGENDFLTCNDCARREMHAYIDFARKDGQPLAASYGPSARIVNQLCGEGFVDANVTLGNRQTVLSSSASASARTVVDKSWLMTLGVMFGIGLVL